MSTVDLKKHRRPDGAKRAGEGGGRGDRKESSAPVMTKAERIATRRLCWSSIIGLGLIHLGALAAPFTFTWQGLVALFALHWLCGGIGVCLGYHRLLTHSSFRTPGWLHYTIAAIGSMAFEGSPLDWVADHRKHHALSDQEGDPHSPHDGAWWSHMLWLAYPTDDGDRRAYRMRWAPDLMEDPGMLLIEKLFLPLNIALGLVLGSFGYWLGGWPMAASLVVWGMFLRMVFVLHTTWLVNSASHMWGYRNYATTDDSRNNWWVALLTYGEGWHNNHHAYPRMAKHGHRWWEFDMTWLTVRLLRAVGLATDVVDYRNAAEKKAMRNESVAS
jgi:stearoyl-CoA desaturase (delta-9 desaturase)